jgi:hypothetical protein
MQRIKLAGFRSLQEISASFASRLSGIARIEEVAEDGILVVAEDADWPIDQSDYDSLCNVITETLAYDGIVNVSMSPVPPRP